jgi:hypothetical protein
MKLSRFLLPAVLGLMCLPLTSQVAHADVITFFDFNDNNYNSDGGARTSTINTGDFIDPDDIEAQSATGTPLSDPAISRPAGAALAAYNVGYQSGLPNQGKFITFAVNTSNYEDLNLSFATQRFDGPANEQGFNSNDLQYSLDGTNFTTLSNYTPSTTANFELVSFNFSGISGLNNNANAAFRIVFNGGSTTDLGAANAIDNIVLTGNSISAVATPEPSTYAMMALGLAALCVLGTKRKKNEAAL